MKEIEILVEVLDSKEAVLEKLQAFNYQGIKKTLDIYFFDPLRKNLQPDRNNRLSGSCRLRNKNGQALLAYKTDNFDEKGVWIYSDEHEIEISDFKTGHTILSHLGMQTLIELENEKHTFLTDEFEIVFEDVKNLGLFLEVEAHTLSDTESVQGVKKRIQQFIDGLKLNVSEELNAGKPELMLRKNGAKIRKKQ